jgi:hypothetical protein
MTAAVRYEIRVSAASMPNKVRSPYCHVAVMAVEPGYVVKEISDRRPGRRVVAVWRKLPARGKTERSAYIQALIAANEVLRTERQRHINELIGQV